MVDYNKSDDGNHFEEEKIDTRVGVYKRVQYKNECMLQKKLVYLRELRTFYMI